MYNPKKLSLTQNISKKSITYGTILSIILMLFTFLPFIPNAHGFTNQFAQIAQTSCQSCANPVTVSDTALNTNDLIVIQANCITSFAITGITDTITNVFSNTGTTLSWSFSNNKIISTHTGTTTLYNFAWFAQAKSTSASTASITFSAAASDCTISSFDGNTVFTAFLTAAIGPLSYTANIQTTGTFQSIIQQSYAANSIILGLGEDVVQSLGGNWNGNGAGSSATSIPPLGYIGGSGASANSVNFPLSDGACSGSGCVLGTFYGTFQTGNTAVNTGLGFNVGQYGTTSNFHATSELVYVFNISGTIQSSGTTQSQNLCSSTFTPTGASTKTGNMISNYTYWSPLYNAIGIGSGNTANILNITLWVASISLTNAQTAVDIYVLIFIPGGAFSPNNQPQLPSATTPWNTIFNYPSQTGVAAQGGKVLLIAAQHFANTASPFKISTTTSVGVAAGVSFAVGIYITHNGVNLVKCTGSYPQLYQQQVPASVITNSGFDVSFAQGNTLSLGYINTANLNGTTPYLYVLMNTPGTTTIQTVTSTIFTVTSFSTVTSTSTTGIATTTITTTTTVITNAFASPTGGAQIETNIITYWPIWALPLIFGALGGSMGFGLGGLLFGLMFALIIMQLTGQVPLWTVFIDIVMIYVILRR